MGLIYAFSKRVRDEMVFHQQIVDDTDVARIAHVLGKLEELPKGGASLDEIGLRTNPKRWVKSLLEGYPDNVNNEDAKSLLIDFTDVMKTRMREESRWAIGLLIPSKLILCHSVSGEETITPEWKTIPRMLDTGNVLRYVCFVEERGIIHVRFWEREATISFIEWLNLPRKESFLFGGVYRICCDIEGVTTEFQLTEEEMGTWMKNHPELREGRIKLMKPVELLSINEIRGRGKRYQNPQDFIQDYEAEAYGIPFYKKECERLKREAVPMLLRYYDEKTRVVRIEGEDEVIEVAKSTPGFDILFVNDFIEFRASYLNDLVTRFVNNEPMSIFHAYLKFKTPPIVFGGLKIYNEVRLDSLAQLILDYYNSINLQDKILSALLKYTILKILFDINKESPIAYLLGVLCNEVIKLDDLEGKLSKLEDKVLEYKSRDFLTMNDGETVEKLSGDIENKLKQYPCKIYILGVEDNGTLDSIPASRLKSDRIEGIKNGLMKKLKIAKIYTLPIVKGEKGILLVIALRA